MRDGHGQRAAARSIGRVAVCLALLSLAVVGRPLQTSAQEAPETQVGIGITRTSGSPQPSGSPFTYDIAINCDQLGGGGGTEADTCEAPVITIPLSPELQAMVTAGLIDASAFTVEPAALIESVTIVGGNLVIDLPDLPVGFSGTFQMTFTPPNYVTPNGTDWVFEPTLSGGNFDPVTADPSADGEATATLDHTINKYVEGNAFRQQGEEFTYGIEVACNQRSTGTVLAESMTVTDTIPDGVTFVSADPAPTSGAPDGPLSWTLTGGDLPPSCTEPGGTGTALIEVTVVVDDDAPYGTEITNTAGVTSTTTDGQTIPEKTDPASITVIDADDPDGPGGVGSFRKDSFGQLRDDDAAPSDNGAGLESESHTTYPGNWMGVFADQSGNPLSGYTPNQATGMRQAGYKMEYDSPLAQGAGFQHDLVDPVPCLTNQVDQVYYSNDPGTFCTAPAFHVQTVSVWSSTSGGVPAITAGWVPQVRYSDGTTADLVASPGNGANNANFHLPDSPKTVSELFFPRDAGLAGPTVRWAVFGYVDQTVQQGEIVKNRSVDTTYWLDQQAPRAILDDDADLYVVDGPQTGIEKDLGGVNGAGTNATSLTLTGRARLLGAATTDVVLTDLLPLGMVTTGTLPTPSASVTHVAGDGTTSVTDPVAGNLEVIDNFQGSGRQLIRITFPAASLQPFGSLELETSNAFTVSYDPEPGTYFNDAQIYYVSDALLPTCQQSPAYEQQSDEAIDLNQNGTTTDNHCASKDSLTIPPPSGPAAFKTTKTVRGDADEAPKSYPAIGTVTEAGGTVTFGLGWKNVGSVPLTGAVIYDVAPRPGDTGVGGSVAGQPRNSEFIVTVIGVGPLPPDVTIEYSQALNPCRPEVYPNDQNPGCVDDWSFTAPADPATVTAARFVSSATYQPGEGFEVDVYATTPDIDAGQIAWNSIAGGAETTQGTALNPNSPPKVGITADSTELPLLLDKQVDPAIDATDVAVGDQVDYFLSIANPDLVTRTITAVDQMPPGLEFVSIEGVDGAPTDSITTTDSTVTFTDLEVPSGATYTWRVTAEVTEGAVGTLENQFSGDGGEPVNRCLTDPEVSCANIVVPPETVTIAKAVTGDGSEFAPDTFPITITCYLPGDPDTLIVDETVDLADGGSDSFDVPQRAVCQVTEDDDGGATEATLTIDGQPYDAGTPFTPDGSEIAVAIDNRFDEGYLVINKIVTGVGADLADDPFVFSVDCTFEGAEVAGFPQDVDLQPEPDTPLLTSDEIGPLPIGASCTVTETDSGDADFTPAPITVDIVASGQDATVEVTFTNSLSAGTIAVRKDLAGDYAETGNLDDVVFTIDVTCTYEGSDLFTQSVELRGGAEQLIVDGEGDPVLLPVGATCTAVEDDPQGASQDPIISDPVTVVAGSPSELQAMVLTVTNTFDAGTLVVTKEITGVGAPLAVGPFDFDVACTFQGADVPGFPQQVELERTGDDTTLTSDPLGPLPVGASCLVSEVDQAGADVLPEPVAVDITANDDENQAVVVIDNPYSAGTISVTKALAGTYADLDQVTSASFDLEVTCLLEVDGADETIVDETLTVQGGETATVADDQGDPLLLPIGTRCWAFEPDDGDATSSSVDHGDEASALVVQAGQPDELQKLTVTATNTFDADVWSVDDAIVDQAPGTGPIARTGAPIEWWVMIGAVLLAAGGFTVAVGRRLRRV